ncbi:hypothetical protein CRV15_30020 (plasmid) [Streptomyces clavuligerus]|uniref:Uncharacterized protein n=1 Tax=Streptomyces clavuligerus TaxID=1901 RepID=B5GZL3_STRCL|nr:hypothetical protein SSCG_04830 [Streptomyces clavuligerus]EFG03887.1 Hypothetical protein SCLAV_p0397 [Streptomyces clavuligerus]QCS09843.1 hypothetical protein CRV15_30020 [Streptomyces clavuligerus]QPJ98115.1 hypothetical protein GE265_34415 [Streptomyces clavuligerus]
MIFTSRGCLPAIRPAHTHFPAGRGSRTTAAPSHTGEPITDIAELIKIIEALGPLLVPLFQ